MNHQRDHTDHTSFRVIWFWRGVCSQAPAPSGRSVYFLVSGLSGVRCRNQKRFHNETHQQKGQGLEVQGPLQLQSSSPAGYPYVYLVFWTTPPVALCETQPQALLRRFARIPLGLRPHPTPGLGCRPLPHCRGSKLKPDIRRRG